MTPLPAWLEMVLLCLALYGTAKVVTFRALGPSRRGISPGRVAGYLVLWPGLDAERFCTTNATIAAPPPLEWIQAGTKTVLGMIVTWGLARRFMPESPLVAGWLGMTGLAFVVPFGLFHFMSLGWRCRGVDARPVMLKPHRATSLPDFWGRRWDLVFHHFLDQFIFRPARHSFGGVAALWLSFLASGLVHDCVISIPARAGFGLPTLYFLMQALGITLEHTSVLRRHGFGRGFRGWLYTVVWVVAPLGLLFHRPFIERIVLPGLRALGAM